MCTHLSQLYDTNHVPSDTELLEIEHLLAPHSVRLSQLEKDLKEAEAKVATLKKEREDVLRVVKPLKALSSLIRRFPREVMELIFMYSTPGARPTLSICHAPLVLLRVCRSWREIALTTPQLWKSVDISLPPHLFPIPVPSPSPKIQQRVAVFIEQIDRWIERSENCPLSVTLRGSPFNSAIIPEIVSSLAVHSNRWESVDFDASMCPGLPLLSIDPDSLPTLQHLRFSSSSFAFPFEGQDRPSFNNGIFAAAQLKTLHLLVSHSFRRYLTIPINWTNLTRLSFQSIHAYAPYPPSSDDPTAPDMLPILNQCRNLRILSLLLRPRLNPPPAVPTGPGTQITVPSLEALNITGCRYQIHFLLLSIETPSIREVQYGPSSNPSPPQAPPLSTLKLADPLTSFLRRYGHQMEVLSIILPSVSKEDFGSWLECTPVLKQLTLGNPPHFGPVIPPPIPMYTEGFGEASLDDSCIESLTPKQDQMYLCPKLKIFRCTLKSRLSGDTMLAFLEARTSSTDDRSRIEEVVIHELSYDFPFGERMDEEDERLKLVREAGVRLSFKKTFYYNNPAITVAIPAGIGGLGYGVDFGFF